MSAEACADCGDSLSVHIGNKPCVVGESPADRRARYVRDQEAKRNQRLFGEEPERAGCPNCHQFARHGYAPGCVAGKGNSGRRRKGAAS